MDKQIALMKKLQKDPNTIAYAHSDEIILIKREFTENGSVVLVEISISIDTEKATSTRIIQDTEMSLSEFEAMKELLTNQTVEEFNADWRITHKDVGLEKLENTEILCLPSVEDEYIAKFDKDSDFHTIKNAMEILDFCLTAVQKERYIRHKMNQEPTTHIAASQGVSQASVYESIVSSENKIKKFLKNR